MKYSQFNKKRGLGNGFYIVTAVCLLIIGGASWFALSGYSQKENNNKNGQSSNEYTDNTPSYTESVPQVIPETTSKEEAAKPVTDQPYSSKNETVSQIEETVAFMLPVTGEIIKNHSDKELQYSATYGDMRLHLGIDIAANVGSQINACGDGTVKSVDKTSDFGNVVTIEHKGGITVKYAAIEDVKVKQGSSIKMGDAIGNLGTVPCECNDKSHLHIEVIKDGNILDPLKTLGLD